MEGLVMLLTVFVLAVFVGFVVLRRLWRSRRREEGRTSR